MADEERGGNALLNSIAHPTIVNPLAAYRDAASVANSIWQTREWQARQAAGQASAGAIDETGTFVPATANRNLAAAGPGAALAAQETIKNNQALQGAQITQGDAARKIISNELGPLMALPDDQLGAGITGAAARLRAARIPEAVIDQTLLNMPGDPAGQRQYLNQLRLQLAPPDQLQENLPGYGKPIIIDNGQQIVGGNQSAAGGGVTVPPGQGVQKQTSPETNAGLQKITVPDPDHPGTFIEVYKPRSALPGASGVAPRGGAAPPVPSPIPGGGVYHPRGAPATPATTTPAPAPAQPAPAAPAPDQVLAAPPQGQPDRLAAGNKLYTEANAAIPDQQKRLIAGESALDAMKLAATGPSTGYVAQAKAWLEARGETPDGTDGLSPAAARQVLQKQLLRFADNQSKAAGTDLRLETQMHSNANPDMLASANRHVLIQDIGILRRDMVMNKMMPQGEGALEHVKNFPTNTDPRGFAWDAMTPKERAEAEADAQKSQGGLARLDRSIELAHRGGLIKVPSGNAK